MLFCRGKITMQGTAFILIRSVVPNPDDRKAFDHWYETDHFPLVLSKINITQGWRFWSHSDPAVHYALVEFSGMDSRTTKILGHARWRGRRVAARCASPLIEEHRDTGFELKPRRGVASYEYRAG